MTLTRENYHDYPAASQSSLAYLDPNMGGSPIRFKNYLTMQIEKKDSLHMERGRLLHKFMEDRKNFMLSPENAPSETICQIVKAIHVSMLESGIEKLEEAEQQIFDIARSIGYQNNWGKQAIVKNVIEKGRDYFDHLIKADGKIMVQAETKNILENQTRVLSPVLENLDKVHKDHETKSEFPILFKFENVEFKSLLDKLYIDHKNRVVYYYDLKTSSTPVSQFMGWEEIIPSWTGPSYQVISRSGPFHWYRIYRQMAMYREAARSEFKNYSFICNIIVVESIEPYETFTFEVSPDYLGRGYDEILSLIPKINSISPFKS